MRVFLLRIDDRGPVFYSEDRGDGEDGATTGPAARGWIERRVRRLRAALRKSKGGLGQRMARLWGWLQRQIAPDEGLLRGLRTSPRVDLFHPTRLSPEQARAVWDEYLAGRRSKHLVWSLVDAVAGVVAAVLLTPIPGPNVLGLWFAFRAIGHLLAMLGAWRALRGRVTIAAWPSEALDVPLEAADAEQIARVAECLGLKGLGGFLRRRAA